jgi:hypothetical protein
VPRLGELYSGICLTTEENARKNLSQGSSTITIHRPNNKNKNKNSGITQKKENCFYVK